MPKFANSRGFKRAHSGKNADISYYSWNLEDGQAISIKRKSLSSGCLVELHFAFDKFELFVVLFQQDNTVPPPHNWGAETKVGENSSE